MPAGPTTGDAAPGSPRSVLQQLAHASQLAIALQEPVHRADASLRPGIGRGKIVVPATTRTRRRVADDRRHGTSDGA